MTRYKHTLCICSFFVAIIAYSQSSITEANGYALNCKDNLNTATMGVYNTVLSTEAVIKNPSESSQLYKDIGAIYNQIGDLIITCELVLKKIDIANEDKYSNIQHCKLEYIKLINKLDSIVWNLQVNDSNKFQLLKNYKAEITSDSKLINSVLQREKELEIQKFKFYIITSVVLMIILICFLTYFLRSHKNLTRTERERIEFFSILSHELRTPIYGIDGITKLIEKESSISKKNEYFESLKKSTKHMAILIDNVLQASRYKYNERHLYREPAILKSVLNDLKQSMAYFIKDKNLKFETDFQLVNSSRNLKIDVVALNQILTNLLYNAIKFTPKDKCIFLKVIEMDFDENFSEIFFEVKDEGIGVKKGVKIKDFSSFKMSELSNEKQGTGLGLMISQKLLGIYNSKLNFVSEKGKGSSFFFKIKFETSAKSYYNYLEKQLSDRGNIIEVLVVDDNKVNTLITQRNVEKIPFTNCDVCHRGCDAIKKIQSKYYDVVLMDINMPNMSGYEATKHIKKISPKTYVIALTALNYSEVYSKMEACNMDDIITKPFNFLQFKNKIISRQLTKANKASLSNLT